MSETYKWATLDNSDAITIEAKSGYYALQSTGGTPMDLMSFSSFKNVVTYNIWDEEQVYDSIIDAALDTGGYTGRNGDYSGLRIASSYFKSGDITNLSYIIQGDGGNSTTNKVLAIAIYKNGKYTVKSHCVQGEIIPFDANTIEGAEQILDRNLKIVHWTLSESITIDKDFLDDSMAGLFLFAPNDLNAYQPGTVFTHEEMRSKETIFYKIRILCMHRGLNDSVSFSYEKDGTSSSPDYIPFLSYTTVTNNIEDHITDNFNKYHLDADSISDVSFLKYSAPFIQSIKKINNINATWNEIYISDKSLKGITYSDSMRIGRFNLTGSKISKISLPFNFAYSWYDGNDGNNLTTYKSFYLKGLEDNQNKDYGIMYLPMYLEISFTNTDGERKWYRSKNALSQNYPKNPRNFDEPANTLVEYEFDFEGVEAVYEGNGIWVRVYNGERLNYESDENGNPAEGTPSRLTVNDMAISYYQAATSSEDYINLHKYINTVENNAVVGGEWVDKLIHVTAPLKIFFDYKLRHEWNELVDNHLYDNELIKYNLFDIAKDTDIDKNAPQIDRFNKCVLSGIYSPSVSDLNENYYLYTVTFISGNGDHWTNGTMPVYLAIYDHTKNKITYSINSLVLGNTRVSPTWIFAADEIGERLSLSGGDITIALSKNNTETNIANVWENSEGNGNGIFAKTFDVKASNNSSKIYVTKTNANEWSDERVPSIIFGFKHNKIKDLEERLVRLESLI